MKNIGAVWPKKSPDPKETLARRRAMPRRLDELGRAHGVGTRKAAVARVWVKPGSGTFVVNRIPSIEYFPRYRWRNELLRPFTISNTLGKFDVWCNVSGGGLSSQAEAARLGISRALRNYAPVLATYLRRDKLLSVDKRKVERKKPGRKKARKLKQWVKR